MRDEKGEFCTAYTVEYRGEVFIVTEREYDALAESGPNVADGSIGGDDAIGDFLRGLGALD